MLGHGPAMLGLPCRATGGFQDLFDTVWIVALCCFEGGILSPSLNMWEFVDELFISLYTNAGVPSDQAVFAKRSN